MPLEMKISLSDRQGAMFPKGLTVLEVKIVTLEVKRGAAMYETEIVLFKENERSTLRELGLIILGLLVFWYFHE